MNEIDDLLKSAMRRDPAPPDFAKNVLAKARALDDRRVVVISMWRRPATWAIAAGLMVAAIIPPAVVHYRHEQEQQAKALKAKHELLLALEVTRLKLRQTRERIQRTTRHTL